jgi:hypothetical protein
LIDTSPKKAKKVRQASAAGGYIAYNINTGLEAGSHAGFITFYINHPVPAEVKHE